MEKGEPDKQRALGAGILVGARYGLWVVCSTGDGISGQRRHGFMKANGNPWIGMRADMPEAGFLWVKGGLPSQNMARRFHGLAGHRRGKGSTIILPGPGASPE